MPKMDPFYEGLSVMGEYSYKGIQMKLARKTIKRLITFGKRDFTFVSVSDHPRGDGAWVSGTGKFVWILIGKNKFNEAPEILIMLSFTYNLISLLDN